MRYFLVFLLLLGLMPGTARATVRVDLNKDWSFRLDKAGRGESDGWYRQPPQGTVPIAVPHSWNIGADHDFEGVGWYFRTVELGGDMAASHIELHFGATFSRSRIWVNGVYVGGHEGGYTAYWFDIGKWVHNGENIIAVAIDNRPGFATIPGYAMLQHSSVRYDWWPYGGLVRDVWLDVADAGLIRRQRIDSRVETHSASVEDRVHVENVASAPKRFRVVTTAYDPDGNEAARAAGEIELPPGQKGEVPLTLAIRNPRLWNVGAGKLYRLDSRLLEGDRSLDRKVEEFGLRTVEIRDRRLYVNGQPVRLTGVTRHEDSPWEGLAETSGTIKRDWNDLAALHTTLTRPVHYPQNPAVFDEADRDGILLIPEIPVWQFSAAQLGDPRVIDLARRMMSEMIEQAGNHPSIFAWSICNESDVSSEGGQDYVRQVSERVRQLDPRRFVSLADSKITQKPWRDRPILHSLDFLMANAYFGSWSGPASDLDPWLDFVDRAYPDKMVIISEFGWVGPFSRGRAEADRDRRENFLAQLSAFERRDFVAGAILWTYQDYKSWVNLYAGENEGYVDHGLVDADRQRKPSYAAWEERNRPATASVDWLERTDTGVAGFRARFAGRGPREIPFYPLVGLRAEWKAVTDEGVVLGEGSEPLPPLDHEAVLEKRWRMPDRPSGIHMTIELVSSDGRAAGSISSDFVPLRLGGAPFQPDPAQLPPADRQ